MGDARARRRRRTTDAPTWSCRAWWAPSVCAPTLGGDPLRAATWRWPTRKCWSWPGPWCCGEVRGARRDAPARGQRAQRHLPGPGGAAPKTWLEADPHRSGGPFRDLARREDRPRHGGGGPESIPNWDMGPKITDRLGHPDEQGARGDRGALALRRAAGARRRGGASPVHRALAGRVRGRLGARPARPARHARAHRGGPQPIRSVCPWTCRDSIWPSSASLDFEEPDRERFPCLELAYRRPARAARRRRPCRSTRPTRSRWLPSWLEDPVPVDRGDQRTAVLDAFLAEHEGTRLGGPGRRP